MRPPTDQALKKALHILLESSNSENATPTKDNSESLMEVHDKRIKEYELLIDSTQAALGEELKKRHRQRNILAPIHRLPLSVFTSILTFCIDEDPDVNSTRPALLQQLASVSSRWLKTVKSTPTLWTVIDGSWVLQTVQLFLRKSERSPLSIRQMASGESGPKVRAFLAAVLPHRARWQSVTFSGSGVGHFEVPASILRKIQITSPSSSLSITLESLEPFPAIKLGRKSFIWTEPMTGLRTLHLGGLSNNIPTCRQLLEAIAGSPQLESIHLFKWTAPNKDPDIIKEEIYLPDLHALCCKKIPASIQYAIAQSVVAPNLGCLSLDFGQVVGLQHLQQIMDTIGDRFLPLIEPRKYAQITVFPSRIRFSSPTRYSYPTAEEGVEMGFSVAREEDIPVFKWLSYNLPLPGASIVVKLYREISTEAAQYLSGATRLISMGDYFKIIAKPTANGQVTWPLPNLSKLELRYDTLKTAEFKDFVEDRWGACGKANTLREGRLGVLERPRRLRTLELPDGFAPKVSNAGNHALGRCGRE